MTDKTKLRAELRQARRVFAAGMPGQIVPPPIFLDALSGGAVVASYVPVGDEAPPSLFDAAARAAGATLAWPVVVDRASPIGFHAAADDRMVDGPFGLRQPAAGSPAVMPDIILTPLVGFDAHLNRLGQGAGHYDRAFAASPDALRIGIAWSVQRVDRLPADPWDVPLHAVVTERGVLLPGEID